MEVMGLCLFRHDIMPASGRQNAFLKAFSKPDSPFPGVSRHDILETD